MVDLAGIEPETAPAVGIEALVRARLGTLLGDPCELSSVITTGTDQATIIAAAAKKVADWPFLGAADFGVALNGFVSRISVLAGRVEIAIHPDQLMASIRGTSSGEQEDDRTTVITGPVRVQQRGQEMRLVFGSENGAPPEFLEASEAEIVVATGV